MFVLRSDDNQPSLTQANLAAFTSSDTRQPPLHKPTNELPGQNDPAQRVPSNREHTLLHQGDINVAWGSPPPSRSATTTGCEFSKSNHPSETVTGQTRESQLGYPSKTSSGFSSKSTTSKCVSGKLIDLSPSDMDNTDYLLPVGMSPFVQNIGKPSPLVKPSSSLSSSSPASGPTVKELLTPLADQMQKIQSLSSEKPLSDDRTKMAAARCLNFGDDNPNDEPLELPNMVDSFCSNLEPEEEDTLTEQWHESHMEASGEQSRYSVTDYFKKYNRGQEAVGEEHDDEEEDPSIESISGGESLSMDDSDGNLSDMGDVATAVEVDNASSKNHDDEDDQVVEEQTTDTYLKQQGIYRGTELDTSISTIEEVATVTSMGSVNSVDDRAFRQGLANLDANIAKMQQALRESMPLPAK